MLNWYFDSPLESDKNRCGHGYCDGFVTDEQDHCPKCKTPNEWKWLTNHWVIDCSHCRRAMFERHLEHCPSCGSPSRWLRRQPMHTEGSIPRSRFEGINEDGTQFEGFSQERHLLEMLKLSRERWRRQRQEELEKENSIVLGLVAFAILVGGGVAYSLFLWQPWAGILGSSLWVYGLTKLFLGLSNHRPVYGPHNRPATPIGGRCSVVGLDSWDAFPAYFEDKVVFRNGLIFHSPLGRCPACNTARSSSASACPSCGKSMKEPASAAGGLGGCLFVILLGILCTLIFGVLVVIHRVIPALYQ